MRLYTAESLETLRASRCLKQWTADGFLTHVQHDRLAQETSSSLRTTNIFLRVVLCFFTLVVVCGITGLLLMNGSPASERGAFLVLALLCYAGAEAAVSQARLYRHGIEEALVGCSIVFLFLALRTYSKSQLAAWIVLATCSALSIWVWHRFSLWYMLLAAMVFAAFLPGNWTVNLAARHLTPASLYAVGLLTVIKVRQPGRHDPVDRTFSIAEALLWLGVYAAINLKLTAIDLPNYVFGAQYITDPPFGRAFYWSTWILTWLLPPFVLGRGFRRKDRLVLAAGAVVATLTLVTNKPYLGWPRHTWDPMLLGILLMGGALYGRRWLAQGAGGVRHGFTAARLSLEQKRWLDTSSAVLGIAVPHAISTAPQAHRTEVPLQGGASGGGGASRNF